MDDIWRFFRATDRRWHWQRLAADRSLLAESRLGHEEYESCVADARAQGYEFQPSQEKTRRLSSR